MTAKDTELWADLKEVQASMAIEGFDISEEQLERIYDNTKNSPMRAALRELKKQAIETGADYGELVDEYLDLLDAQEEAK